MTQTPKHRRVAKRPADEIPGGMLSELERLNRILRTLSAGNRLLLRSNEEQQLLQGMCDVVVTQGDIAMPAFGTQAMTRDGRW